MPTWQLVGLLLLGMLLVAGSVLLRARYGESYGLTTTDLVLLFVPLLIALLLAGRLKGLEFFGVKMDLSQVFAEAAATSIARQVAELPSPSVEELVSSLRMATKGGVREIPKLMQGKVQALVFRLGHGGYYGPAIEEYLKSLSRNPDFRHLIVEDRQGRFFGLYTLAELEGWLREGRDRFETFTRWLNSGDEEAKRRLAALPGFVGAGLAVSKSTSRREALRKMEELGRDELPVVDEKGAFAGIVTRSHLTASLILEVLDRLEER